MCDKGEANVLYLRTKGGASEHSEGTACPVLAQVEKLIDSPTIRTLLTIRTLPAIVGGGE